jgi:hypothetical protein
MYELFHDIKGKQVTVYWGDTELSGTALWTQDEWLCLITDGNEHRNMINLNNIHRLEVPATDKDRERLTELFPETRKPTPG